LESGERQVEGLCMGLVSNLRAGQGLPDALRSAVARSGPPLQAVLDRALSRHHAGVPLLTALEEAATAARLRGLRYLVDVLAIYQYGGGDLSSLLTLTAGTLKERRILRQQARARTTEARLSVRLLAGLPLVVGVYLLLWQPWVLEPLVQYPAGRLGLAAGAGCWLMGIAVTGYMLRTVDGEVEA
jgi:tight adherence protein B